MNSNNLKDIFENLQDGTVLAFYRGGLIGSIIPFFTREKKGEKAPHHVGIVYEVKKRIYNGHAFCKFKLSEQGFHGGKYRTVEIIKYDDIFYTTDEYFLKQDSIKMARVKMTETQIQLGILDAISQIGKKYGYSRLILGAEFVEKILPKEFRRNLFLRLNKKEEVRMCSLHVPMNLKNAGIDVPLDDVYSPLEVLKIKNIYV
jgi:hypothetical protein